MENNISWHALEYKKREKTADWYWAVIIIAISIIVISILIDNILFAVLVILSVIALLMFSNRDPLVVEVEIDERGVRVQDELYPFSTLEAFWIDITDAEDHKIILKSKKTMMPLIMVPIAEYDYKDIRIILLNKIEEKELQEPLSQKIMAKLGF